MTVEMQAEPVAFVGIVALAALGVWQFVAVLAAPVDNSRSSQM